MPKETFTLRSTDNSALFVRKWTPDNISIGVICLVHGLGEHCGRYDHVAAAFNKSGFAFVAYDQRGHGKSDGKRGDVHSYDQLLDDLRTVIDQIKKQYDKVPLFLYGHSMGGNVVSSFLLKRDHGDIRAAIITSPWFTLAFDPPRWQLSIGKLILKLAPGLVQSNKLNPNELSNDQQVGVDYKNDPLVHDKISPRLFFAIHDMGLVAIKNARDLEIPVLVVHGTKDPITSPESSAIFARNSDNDFKAWEGLLHETHNEINKEEVIDFNIQWIKKNL